MASRPSCILLAGAPEVDSLAWDEARLLSDFDIHFTRILAGRSKAIASTQGSSSSTSSAPKSKWRSVELHSQKLDIQSGAGHAVPQTQFLSFNEDGAEREREHSDFLEHSVALFDDLASSQILQRDGADGDPSAVDTTIDFTTMSFATTSATDSSFDVIEGSHSPAQPLKKGHDFKIATAVSTLKQIPTADYITHIRPQTMTVNLLVGIVTVSPARSVHLKKSNAEMDIIELIVGDETRAGFTTSFWLVPIESKHKPADDLRDVLGRLRAGDVVLLQNVALSCFRNRVYGQSLSKRFARNSTSVIVMDGDVGSALPPALFAKLQRVRDWACEFVEMGKKHPSFASSIRQRSRVADALPPDTQD